MIFFCAEYKDLSILRDLNGGWISVKDQIWLEQAQINKDKLLYMFSDCHTVLIEIRQSLCQSPLKLPSDAITKRNNICGVAEIIKKAD